MTASASETATASLELDDVHRDFQQVCRSFVEREVMPRVRDAELAGTYPAELWKPMGEAGPLSIGFPEEVGGSGGGVLAIGILSEELGRACGGIAVTPLVSSYMAASHIVRFGTPEQQRAHLLPVSRGEAIAAVAVTEPGAGSDVASIRTTATRVEGGWKLDGTKMFITNAGFADVLVVGAKTDRDGGHNGMSTFLVRKDAEGMTLGPPLPKMGWHSSDTREVAFDGVVVAEEDLLGTEGRGFHQIMECFQPERIILAGMGVGLAQGALDAALAHARERQAFGRHIGSFQAISHRLGEMATDIAAARLLTYQAGARWDAGHPDAAATVAMAKLLAARVANDVADDAVQILGGSGFIEEGPVAMHYRDARILRIGGGTDEVQLEILAKRMGL